MVSRQSVLTKVFGDPQKRLIKGLEKRVAGINALADKYKKMSKAELREQTDVLKKRLQKKDTKLDDVLPDAFALVREASDRVLKMRHFDVQLIGGMVLHDGNVAEMKTGEGKTLVATLPVYLSALIMSGVRASSIRIESTSSTIAKLRSRWRNSLTSFVMLSRR